jgi:hypothetical protein
VCLQTPWVILWCDLTLAGGLQGVHIGGSNDPYLRRWAQASGDGPRSARQKLAFTL